MGKPCVKIRPRIKIQNEWLIYMYGEVHYLREPAVYKIGQKVQVEEAGITVAVHRG